MLDVDADEGPAGQNAVSHLRCSKTKPHLTNAGASIVLKKDDVSDMGHLTLIDARAPSRAHFCSGWHACYSPETVRRSYAALHSGFHKMRLQEEFRHRVEVSKMLAAYLRQYRPLVPMRIFVVACPSFHHSMLPFVDEA